MFSERELEKGFIFKILIPAGGRGGGRHGEKPCLDQEGGILLDVCILLHFLLSHSLLYYTLKICYWKTPRTWAKITMIPNINSTSTRLFLPRLSTE